MTDQEQGTPESGKVVQYVGYAQERTFTQSDLQIIDPEFKGEAVVFNAENRFTVPEGELTETLVKVLKSDPDFVHGADNGKSADRVDEKVALARAGGFITSRVPA